MKTAISIILTAICSTVFFSSCDKCRIDIACTMEFRMIHVEIKNPDNSAAQIDEYYVIKQATGDTLRSHADYDPDSAYFEGILLFTDNDMEHTNTQGCEFILSCYRDDIEVLNESYIINHDLCHINLVSGKTEFFLSEKF